MIQSLTETQWMGVAAEVRQLVEKYGMVPALYALATIAEENTNEPYGRVVVELRDTAEHLEIAEDTVVDPEVRTRLRQQ